MQSLIAFIVVASCFAYAAWSLMPQVARRWLASRLLQLPLPQGLRPALEKAVSASAGCHCSGCDKAQPKVGPVAGGARASVSPAQVLVFHPRKHT